MRAVARVLGSGQFVLGSEVADFEHAFAAFLGARHVIGVASGTDAIELLLRAHNIGPGMRVALPALAPSAVASAVQRAGAEIALVDVEDDSLTLCPKSLEWLLKSRDVHAVLVVHLFGQPAAWAAIHDLCAAHHVLVLEDASQAHGASVQGTMAGALGTAAALSFYPTKNLGALGDAGAIATSSDELAEKLRALREYGWCTRHVSESCGVNSRLDELQAAFLHEKLPFLAAQVEKRREMAAHYLAHLHGVRLPQPRAGTRHAFHQFVVRSSHREALRAHLQHFGIPTAVHYPRALHQQPAFVCHETFPVAERAVNEVLSLPLHPHLSQDALYAVCAAVNAFHA